MKLHFNIPYKTYWGQRILVSGNLAALGNGDFSRALSLSFTYPENWSGVIDASYDELFNLKYRYLLLNEQTGQILEEWGDFRVLSGLNVQNDEVFCYDQWNPANAPENTFLTAPFQEVLLKDNHEISTPDLPAKYTHVFSVNAPLVPQNQIVCLAGDCKALSDWSTRNPILMKKTGSAWQVGIDLSKCKGEVHFKYGYYDPEDKKFICFEEGQDRTAVVINNKKALVNQQDNFVRINGGKFRASGVGMPVFSIRSRKSFGVGDFEDLKLLIDWSAKVGLKLIQVLPLNDTIGTHTDADVLPYAAISAFALNPLFLHLPALGKLPANHPLSKSYKLKQAELNDKEMVEFLEVVNFKISYAKAVFDVEKTKFLNNKDFLHYFAENQYWLEPYAAFCLLRDRFNTPDYRQWNEYAVFSYDALKKLVSPEQEHFDQIALQYFIQYHLHLQLSEAHSYAHTNGIVLKGDIPIGVNRNAVDTWANPELFNLDKLAGAPPDMFAIKGQNWELPTYNWDVIRSTGFDWWKKRFAQMSHYFDTFRIDHILGFFRIWEIPDNQIEGIMGHLFPSTPVHIHEFHEKGIWFDYNRFCKPYITDSFLHDVFGDDASWVRTNCLQIEDGWVLRLKPDFMSQKKIEELFCAGKISEKVKWGLFDLISNVLFFEVEGSNGTQFYPRFGMQALRTFRDLDDFTRSKLDEIYVDYFFRRQDAHWYRSGMDKLPALKRSTNMLICGEDLGMMTKCVTEVMNELGILSLEVQRAPKSSTSEFFHPADAPYMSVVTPSTHDMSTIRGWWEEDRAVTQRFYNTQLGHFGEAPWYCEWWICRDILLQHLYSPAMWAIFQLQDLLSISSKIRRENPNDERVNVPSNSKFSWRYRLHLNIEDLIENDDFNLELKNYIQQAGR